MDDIGCHWTVWADHGNTMEKIDQWEQENPLSDGLEMIDDFRFRGSRTWRRRGGPLTKGGWRTRWRTWRRVPSTTPTLYSQRAKFSPCGPGCARKPALDAGWHGLPASSGVKPRGAPASRVHSLARRVVAPHGRGRWW